MATDQHAPLSESSHGAAHEPPGAAPWVLLTDPRGGPEDGRPGRAEQDASAPPTRLLVTLAVGVVLVLVAVSVVGVLAARKLAERQAVNDDAHSTDLFAEAVVQPALQDGIASGDPAARRALAAAVTPYLESREASLVRVKLWTRDGHVVYSDEPRLVGQQFDLGASEQDAFVHPHTQADVSDLDEPENRFERGQGKLLEAYRPVWTPSGQELLFEAYAPYSQVDARTGQLWRGFAGVTVSSLLLFAVLLFPLLWRLLSRLRAAQRQREQWLERAVDASADERRRIAGTLHDGVVQELAATSFTVAGAAQRSAALRDPSLTRDLDGAAATLRGSIGGLRSLLVDLYPPSLESAGLISSLRDLAGTLRSRDIVLDLDLPETDPGLPASTDRLVYRIAHETLTNARQHASAHRVGLSLRTTATATVLEVYDDGRGFDVDETLARPPEGHLGLRVLADLAAREGAGLAVTSGPGRGTHWRLEVPR